MTKKSPGACIRLRGVRHNNLKNFDLDLPLGRLIAITGLSGSGKSSLAFDTLFAEGQRRYIETFSPYARQFFDRMDKPQVDRIEGIPPAIAIEQRNSVKTTRSTVGTMTELCDYMKLLWPHLAQLYCRACGKPVRKDSPQLIWEALNKSAASAGRPCEVLVTFAVPLSEKLSLGETLTLVAKQGYQRVLKDNRIIRLEELFSLPPPQPASELVIVQDRLTLSSSSRSRFTEACEQAYHFGKGKLTIGFLDANGMVESAQRFSAHLHCADCDLEYREPTAAIFSFNHPSGACDACRGFGRIITIDYNLAIPDRSKTLGGGAVKPWQTGQGIDCQRDLIRMCRELGVPTDVRFDRLSAKWQRWVIDGDPDYGKDSAHEWPKTWYGVKGYFRWLESRAYKMHVRVLLSRYRAYSMCPACQGARFKPDTLLYKILGPDNRLLTLADFYQLPVDEALRCVEHVADRRALKHNRAISVALNEVRLRLGYLLEVGLGYLTLDRPTRTLSGGETERVNLTTCLGTRLTNTLYVLDEPSVGLHARDTARLVKVLADLRNLGNTVVVVEHEPTIMRAADQIVDLGPGSGEAGGRLVFQGPLTQMGRATESLTSQYLCGKRLIPIPARREVTEATPRLSIQNATRNNLVNLNAHIPLGRFVCLSGVSGSGKTTLARELLVPALEARFNSHAPSHEPAEDERVAEAAASQSMVLDGWQQLGRVLLVDQSALGRTPRSNPAVYIGAFDEIREIFAASNVASQRGLGASAFSFNSSQGQCERCRGAGFEKVEMQFLSDIFIRCPDCNGRRYRPHILDVTIPVDALNTRFAVRKNSADAARRSELHQSSRRGKRFNNSTIQRFNDSATIEWSIADVLEATADDAIEALQRYSSTRAGARAVQALKLLQEVGLGYLRLGQPINTLSGGESQRLKLVSELAAFATARDVSGKPTLFVFDEPTTGLHFEDVRVLLQVFQRLVDKGHSVLVIEHNLDVIKSADWVTDLGPEAGARGGQLVTEGTPETIAACAASHTGAALRDILP
jgi:excinuclease ABC subunit A